MTRRKTWRGIVLLGLLALLSWLLARQPGEQLTLPLVKPDVRLNYALYDFSGRLLDEGGSVNLLIESPVLRNTAESGVGTVESPEIHIQQDDDKWYITAESAIISADREHVSLVGDVFLSKRNELTDQSLEIATSDVLLVVTPRTAETEAEVEITQQSDWLRAAGMRLDMINEHYELLNDVRAHYEIP
jgi:LPS export ABC transporter protein LptC